MNREELLTAIRNIVGNKTFKFSDAYLKQCGKGPTIGGEDREYSGITKKYLYISCRVTFGWNTDETECGAFFHRYSIYKNFYGMNVTKIELEKLFTTDLQKIYNDIVFFLWWEKTVHLPKITKEYAECYSYANKFDKLNLSNEEFAHLQN